MKYWPLPLILCCPSLSAQSIFLDEDFSTGVPPAGWTEINNGNSLGWEIGTLSSDAAFHADFAGYNDNSMVSSAMDLSVATGAWLHSNQNVQYASWRDHHFINVSLDGGNTFTNIHDDFSGDGDSTITVDLSAFGGISNVNISFQYTGDYASWWTVDDVLVNDSPNPPPPGILTTAVNPTNGHTYHLLESTTWTEAEAGAVLLGGHLATVRDQAENDWIWSNFSNWGGQDRDLWIGLNDVATEGTFVWSSGETSTFRYWAAGQPDNNGGYENYVHIGELNTDEWNDMFDAASASWSPGYFGVVEVAGSSPHYEIQNLVAGRTATLSASYCEAGAAVYFAYSLTGSGPTTTPYGDVQMSPPIKQIGPIFADSAGYGSHSVFIPPWSTGAVIYTQAGVLDSSSNVILTNALVETIK